MNKIPFDMKSMQNTQGKYESVNVWMELLSVTLLLFVAVVAATL